MKENNFTIYTVFVRTFVILFYYGSGSAKAQSYGSDSTTLFLTKNTMTSAISNLTS